MPFSSLDSPLTTIWCISIGSRNGTNCMEFISDIICTCTWKYIHIIYINLAKFNKINDKTTTFQICIYARLYVQLKVLFRSSEYFSKRKSIKRKRSSDQQCACERTCKCKILIAYRSRRVRHRPDWDTVQEATVRAWTGVAAASASGSAGEITNVTPGFLVIHDDVVERHVQITCHFWALRLSAESRALWRERGSWGFRGLRGFTFSAGAVLRGFSGGTHASFNPPRSVTRVSLG